MRFAYLIVERSAALKASARCLPAQSQAMRPVRRHTDRRRHDNMARPASRSEENLMTKLDNRCAGCGGKFGLVCHHHWGLRFCSKACKAKFLAKTARDHACIRKWFGLSAGGTS
jgi:hypothetical protein